MGKVDPVASINFVLEGPLILIRTLETIGLDAWFAVNKEKCYSIKARGTYHGECLTHQRVCVEGRQSYSV